jgi:hypothetical protein|tara:strand:- start:15373 stop:15636 length:264 start_codon:yes stop_codon:yes gene_type:complete
MNKTEEKIYVGSGKQVKDFDMVNVTLDLSSIKDSQDHVYEFNGKKYINLTVSKRKEVSEYGKTHNVTINTFKPESKDDSKSGDQLPF